MWTSPTETIRYLLLRPPLKGAYRLSLIYALQAYFFSMHWWSLGLKNETYFLLTLGLLFSPVLAPIKLYSASFFYFLAARLLGGTALFSHVKMCWAWSKIPYSLTLGMWIVLLFASPKFLFIQDFKGPYSLFIDLIMIIVSLWSFVLLYQSLREVEKFSHLKTLFLVLFSFFLIILFEFLFFCLIRLAYKSYT